MSANVSSSKRGRREGRESACIVFAPFGGAPDRYNTHGLFVARLDYACLGATGQIARQPGNSRMVFDPVCGLT
jgi:hypothetical protein